MLGSISERWADEGGQPRRNQCVTASAAAVGSDTEASAPLDSGAGWMAAGLETGGGRRNERDATAVLCARAFHRGSQVGKGRRIEVPRWHQLGVSCRMGGVDLEGEGWLHGGGWTPLSNLSLSLSLVDGRRGVVGAAAAPLPVVPRRRRLLPRCGWTMAAWYLRVRQGWRCRQ